MHDLDDEGGLARATVAANPEDRFLVQAGAIFGQRAPTGIGLGHPDGTPHFVITAGGQFNRGGEIPVGTERVNERTPEAGGIAGIVPANIHPHAHGFVEAGRQPLDNFAHSLGGFVAWGGSGSSDRNHQVDAVAVGIVAQPYGQTCPSVGQDLGRVDMRWQ